MVVVKFTKPPLIEVAFAIELEAEQLSSVHVGLYWQEIRERFPDTTDKEPFLENINFPGKILPLRRTVFISSNNTKLIQIQENFFCYNWRYKSEDEYPHFDKIFEDFLYEWNQFENWWMATQKEKLKIEKYELNYVNLIDEELGWKSPNDHAKIFTFVSSSTNTSFGSPDLHDVQLVFTLPDNDGELIIQVDQRISESDEDSSNIVFFKLTTRSFDANKDCVTWFKLAHEYTIKTFLNLTTETIHKEWGLQ